MEARTYVDLAVKAFSRAYGAVFLRANGLGVAMRFFVYRDRSTYMCVRLICIYTCLFHTSVFCTYIHIDTDMDIRNYYNMEFLRQKLIVVGRAQRGKACSPSEWIQDHPRWPPGPPRSIRKFLKSKKTKWVKC